MEVMIHNSSSDPVLIKKISLKVWSLRDEIESRIQEKMDAGEMVPESLEQKIRELQSEYTKKSGESNNVIQLKSSAELPADGEDEMERAMAAAMAGGDEDAEEVVVKSEEATNLEEISEEKVGEKVLTISPQTNIQSENSNIINVQIEAPINLPEEKYREEKLSFQKFQWKRCFSFPTGLTQKDNP